MPILAAFPDVQAMLVEMLADYGTVAVKTGPDLAEKLPFISVQRLGGRDDRFTDEAPVDVDVFTPDYSGLALAETIRQRLTAGPIRTSLGVIDRITTDSAPREIPWTDGSTVRRFAATYRLRARR
jgi:hypothetical protein